MTTLELGPKRAESAADTKTEDPPRKRRRRTATAGATEDCFACQKRNTQCDRKRPYCSPCLEIGNECSGYRTTLTWGVGVASRGKLRGLSLPVAKHGKENTTSKKDGPSTKQRTTKSPPEEQITSWSPTRASNHTFHFQASVPALRRPSVSKKVELKLEGGQSTSRLPNLLGEDHRWQNASNDPTYLSSTVPSRPQTSLQTGLPALQTSFDPRDIQQVFPQSATSARTYNDSGYITPREYPQTATGYFPNHQFSPFTYSGSQPVTNDSARPSTTPGPATNQSDQRQQIPAEDLVSDGRDAFSSDEAFADPTQQDFYDEFDLSLHPDLMGQDNVIDPTSSTNMELMLPRSLFGTQFFHLPPRMQSLLDFYDKHICSVLVTFDGGHNPYREHILHLATHNEGLQNAIAALATNNIRMRTHRQIQHSGFVQELNENSSSESKRPARADIPPPTAEELCYKSLSIDQLNMQLTSAASAQDDSVLATLLILCLFHVCDSGFSKFKTQLAGVQKLLSLRGAGAQSGFLGWVQMFFSWFDVMTSTVNDREAQIKGDSLDMLDYSSNLGALEQFSGCDGRLFKLIARLGRLNLLAQDRPVRLDGNGKQASRQQQSPRSQSGRFRTPFPNPADYYRLDGNGWGSPIIDSPEDEQNDVLGPLEDAEKSFPRDSRHEFWREWHDIRSRLQSWSMDPSVLQTPALQDDQANPEQRDLVNINESFRSSALLYTERLAYPHLPSSAQNFQELVNTGLSHITALSITSCVNKFLLWPLFIIGTECVTPSDRLTVRQRCVEIQRESGFFNNLSVLEVLERVWSETATQKDGSSVDVVEEVRRRRRDSTGHMGGRWGQAFRWRRAMDRVDGEYIVV